MSDVAGVDETGVYFLEVDLDSLCSGRYSHVKDKGRADHSTNMALADQGLAILIDHERIDVFLPFYPRVNSDIRLTVSREMKTAYILAGLPALAR